MRRMLLLLTTMTIAVLMAATVLSSMLVAASFFPHAAYAADAPSASASFECSDRRGGEFVLAITISGYPEGTFFDVYLDGVQIFGNASGSSSTPAEIGGFVGSPFSLSPFVLPEGPHVVTITQPQSEGGAVVHELPFVVHPCNPVEPQTKEDCKKGGYAKYGFKNQGQCIKAVD